MSASTPEWLSIKEYAARYSVHRNTVTKWLKVGIVAGWRTLRTTRVKNVPPDFKKPPSSRI